MPTALNIVPVPNEAWGSSPSGRDTGDSRRILSSPAYSQSPSPLPVPLARGIRGHERRNARACRWPELRIEYPRGKFSCGSTSDRRWLKEICLEEFKTPGQMDENPPSRWPECNRPGCRGYSRYGNCRSNEILVPLRTTTNRRRVGASSYISWPARDPKVFLGGTVFCRACQEAGSKHVGIVN